jgi:hypothetical protein
MKKPKRRKAREWEVNLSENGNITQTIQDYTTRKRVKEKRAVIIVREVLKRKKKIDYRGLTDKNIIVEMLKEKKK